jgi:hypothetical protein
MEWINLAHDTKQLRALVKTVMNLQVSGFIKCWNVLEWLRDCWLLKNGSVPWS